MVTLQSICPDLWCIAVPHRFLGLHLGTRATVVRLGNGTLLVHSPVALTPALEAEVGRLGPVRHVVCPNLYHHVYAGQWTAAWPEALLHGPAGLARKRPDLHFHHFLSAQPHPDWVPEIECLPIDGCLLRETLLLHRPSRTLISSDLTENFTTSDHLPTRLYLRAAGIHGRIGWSRFLRPAYHDRRAARASLERVLACDFDRVILAHGDIIERGGKEAVRQTFAFLR